jgi:hypothetical protein
VLREWKRIKSSKREAKLTIKSGDFIAINLVMFKEEEDVAKEMKERDKGNRKQREREFVGYFPLMDDKSIEHMVVENKRRDILSKYMNENLKEEQVEAKEIFNIQR